MHFQSNIFILPSLGNSGEAHWQSIWQQQFGFTRIEQTNWETPVAADWIETIEAQLSKFPNNSIILVGHSLACTAIALWAATFNRTIKGALLVAPSDTEANTYTSGTNGFKPMPTNKLPFPSIVITSSNDYYVSLERATYLAQCWGSKMVNIGNAGHINVASGLGNWPLGLELLQELDQL